jgi:hypothetical protein
VLRTIELRPSEPMRRLNLQVFDSRLSEGEGVDDGDEIGGDAEVFE